MTRLRALPVYSAAALTDVVLAGLERPRGRRFSKPLLMPLLMADVAREPDVANTKRLVLTGLAFSGAGDTALLGQGEPRFAVGLGSFLAAHCCYLAAFVKRRRGALGARRWLAVAYAVGWAALNAVLWPRTGRLRIPVIVYGTALVAMAIAAVDTGQPSVAAGAASFVASDALLALETFAGVDFPGIEALVMLTYTLAQALIADGMVTPDAV